MRLFRDASTVLAVSTPPARYRDRPKSPAAKTWFALAYSVSTLSSFAPKSRGVEVRPESSIQTNRFPTWTTTPPAGVATIVVG
ncbi:hypothetical protein [Lysobacter gummosus]|uniref:hypothetical protein n=1 Tax=Lysobacter gummosus TaxID=262324 RepID=UPI0036387E06